MIAAIAIAQPAVPSKVNRNNSQAEHHPAKNCAHQSAILKHWMAHQLRMGAHRIDQRAHADADGSASGKQHAHRENLATPTMHQSAFFSHNRPPKTIRSTAPVTIWAVTNRWKRSKIDTKTTAQKSAGRTKKEADTYGQSVNNA